MKWFERIAAWILTTSLGMVLLAIFMVTLCWAFAEWTLEWVRGLRK